MHASNGLRNISREASEVVSGSAKAQMEEIVTNTPPQSTYKIILLGDLGAGKTSLFLRIKCKQFVDTSTDSVYLACDECEFSYSVGGKLVKVKLCDTGGSERFRSLTDNYYRSADAAILCYSLTNNESLSNLYEWYKSGKNMVDEDKFVWAIVGTGLDRRSNVEVDQQEARMLKNKIRTKLNFYVSSKTGENIDQALDKIIAAIHERKLDNSAESNVNLKSKKEQSQSKCC